MASGKHACSDTRWDCARSAGASAFACGQKLACPRKRGSRTRCGESDSAVNRDRLCDDDPGQCHAINASARLATLARSRLGVSGKKLLASYRYSIATKRSADNTTSMLLIATGVATERTFEGSNS